MTNVNVQNLLDNLTFTSFHKKLLFWTCLIIVFDGYDLVIYGSVLPLIMKEWGLTPLEAGKLASYAMFGMMFGAFLFGTIGNKIGVKRSILICIFLFSLFTVLCGFTSSPAVFGIFRFLAGLGIGGVMPNVVSLMSEYAPKNIRNTLITAMFSGIAIGGILSVLVGIYFIPNFGWTSVFYMGAVPLVLFPWMIKDLPDSINNLVKSGNNSKATQILQKITNTSLPENTVLEINQETTKSGKFSDLFKQGRFLSTLMFWVAFFSCLLVIYGINSWLPKLIMSKPEYKDQLGLSLTFLLIYNIGAVAGALIGGWLGDKFNVKKTIIVFFILAAISIGILGYTSSLILYVLVFIAGATTSGNQIVLNSLLAQYYPPLLRSTGFGWASGIGRIGAIIGPTLVGFLVGLNLQFEQNFFVFSIAATLAALAIFFVDFTQKNEY